MQKTNMEISGPMIKQKSSSSSVTPVFKWKVLTIVFIVISVALLIALIVVATKRTKPKSADSGVHTKATVQSC